MHYSGFLVRINNCVKGNQVTFLIEDMIPLLHLKMSTLFDKTFYNACWLEILTSLFLNTLLMKSGVNYSTVCIRSVLGCLDLIIWVILFIPSIMTHCFFSTGVPKMIQRNNAYKKETLWQLSRPLHLLKVNFRFYN